MVIKNKIQLFLVLSGLLCTFSCSAKTPILRFGIIADAQYAYYPEIGGDNRYYRHSIRKMDECVDTFNSYALDFVVSLGDFVDHANTIDNPQQDSRVHCKDYFEELNLGLVCDRCDINGDDTTYVIKEDLHGFSELNAETYHVLGNHDHLTYQWFNNWSTYTEKYSPVAIEEEKTLYGLTHRYYSYVIDKGSISFRFIVLDGNETDGTERTPEGYFPDNKILQPQLNWFADELEDAKDKRQNVIVFCHQGFGKDAGHTLGETTKDSLRDIMSNYSHIVAWMNGHDHRGSFNVDSITGVPFYNFRGMLTGPFPRNNAFSIVELYEDELRVRKFRNEQNSQIPDSRPVQLLINAETAEKRSGQ